MKKTSWYNSFDSDKFFNIDNNDVGLECCTLLNNGVKRSSGWLESWEGLFLATEFRQPMRKPSLESKLMINRLKPSVDSEDGFRTGCWNVSHQQQSISGPQLSRWSFSIKACYSWFQTIFLLMFNNVEQCYF